MLRNICGSGRVQRVHTGRAAQLRGAQKMLMSLFVASYLLGVNVVAAAYFSRWQMVHSQSRTQSGTDTHPSIRYGHTCNTYARSIITTHGYYYDADRGAATWLSDTWQLDAARQPHPWRRLSNHLPQSEAYAAYSSGQTPLAPCGRYGHVSVIIGDALFLYGGNDGGYSRTNRDDYRPGNDFDDFWRLDLKSHNWSWVAPAGSTPGKRYLAAAAAVHGKMILYGGMGIEHGDLWSYSPEENRWERLAEEMTSERGGPGRRSSHSLVAWVAGDAVGVVMYGGQYHGPNGSHAVQDDAWFFDLTARQWRKLEAVTWRALLRSGAAAGASADGDASSSSSSAATAATAAADSAAGLSPAAAEAVPVAVAPPGRLYHAAMVTTVALPLPVSCSQQRGSSSQRSGAAATCRRQRMRVGVIAGGTLTLPRLHCAADAWAFTLDCTARGIAWARLPDIPAALYDTHGAAWAGRAFLLGGHLCSLEHPLRPPYRYYYVNEVLRLDLLAVPAVRAMLRAGPLGGGAANANGSGGVAGAAPPVACVLQVGQSSAQGQGQGQARQQREGGASWEGGLLQAMEDDGGGYGSGYGSSYGDSYSVEDGGDAGVEDDGSDNDEL